MTYLTPPDGVVDPPLCPRCKALMASVHAAALARYRHLTDAVVAFYEHRTNRDNFGRSSEYLRLLEAENAAIAEEIARRKGAAR